MKQQNMTKENKPDINTLGELKKSGYRSRGIKDELRENLIMKLKAKEEVFPGIIGYEDTVIPDLQRAILSRHNIILLGLRGQAKTRIARQMTNLLDEWMPVVDGGELNDDPLASLSRAARDIVEEQGDKAPIAWVHRSERYAEKLATPDVTIADLIGDIDPIKAATLKLSYADERVLHYGLIPRANRSLFVINELPDLQPRIQVALFNILQEGDIQIRGFKLRLPLDVQFVFTANPEDYTNRGSIVTPLKDRIDSQILTHYPQTLEEAAAITRQEAHVQPEQRERVKLLPLAEELIEEVAFEARDSEYVDSKSGVSARLTITAYENLVSAVEQRALLLGEEQSTVRVGDLMGVIPAITGKIELVYEGEQEGPAAVAQLLIGKAIRRRFTDYFPDPEARKQQPEQENPYQPISDWFGKGNLLDLPRDLSQEEYQQHLEEVPGLRKLVEEFVEVNSREELYFMMEFALHGLAEYSLIGKEILERSTAFTDLLTGMFDFGEGEEGDWSDEL